MNCAICKTDPATEFMVVRQDALVAKDYVCIGCFETVAKLTADGTVESISQQDYNAVVENPPFRPGQKVHYAPTHGWPENGIVKFIHPHNAGVVFVVYNCGGDWGNYQNYTGASTQVADLREGWV